MFRTTESCLLITSRIWKCLNVRFKDRVAEGCQVTANFYIAALASVPVSIEATVWSGSPVAVLTSPPLSGCRAPESVVMRCSVGVPAMREHYSYPRSITGSAHSEVPSRVDAGRSSAYVQRINGRQSGLITPVVTLFPAACYYRAGERAGNSS